MFQTATVLHLLQIHAVHLLEILDTKASEVEGLKWIRTQVAPVMNLASPLEKVNSELAN